MHRRPRHKAIYSRASSRRLTTRSAATVRRPGARLTNAVTRGKPVRAAHPGRTKDDGDRQVSWLAGLGRALRLPGSFRPSDIRKRRLSAYSCGGSPGVSPEFPFHPRYCEEPIARRMLYGAAYTVNARNT